MGQSTSLNRSFQRLDQSAKSKSLMSIGRKERNPLLISANSSQPKAENIVIVLQERV